MAEVDSPDGVPIQILCKYLDVSPRRVQQLAREGVIPKSAHGRYPLLQCLAGYIKHMHQSRGGETKAAQEARLKEAQADLRRLEYQQKSGDLVQFSAVRDAVRELGSKAGQLLDGIGQSVCNEIVGETDPVTVAALIDERIAAARELIAGLRIRLSHDRPDPQKPNGHGVGGRKSRPKS